MTAVVVYAAGLLRLVIEEDGERTEAGTLNVPGLVNGAVVDVGLAFAELYQAATRYAIRPSPTRPVARPVSARRLPPGRRGPKKEGLNARVRQHLEEHGPSTLDELEAAIQPEPLGRKSGRARITTAVHSLRRQGMVTQGTDKRWRTA